MGCQRVGPDRQDRHGQSHCTCFVKPVRVQGLPLVRQTAAGGDTVLQNPNGFSVALGRDGTVWTWGSDIFGQLGHPDPKNQVYYPTPGKLLSIDHITDISAGADHVLALRKNGRLWAWGDDSYGELGDGAYCGYHLCARFLPVRVSVVPAARMVSAGGTIAPRSIRTVASGRGVTTPKASSAPAWSARPQDSAAHPTSPPWSTDSPLSRK